MICTGRSSVSGNAQSDYDRPETIEETAALVDDSVATASPSRSTTSTAAQVRALADRIRDDYGAIDILVNDIWGAEVLKGRPPTWNRPIWEHDLDDGLRILRLGIDTHLITVALPAPAADRRGPAACSSRSPTAPGVQRRRTTGSRCSTTSPRSR